MSRLVATWGMLLGLGWTVSQAGVGETVHDTRGDFRKVFVTSVTGTGNLSSWPDAGMFTGLDAGDAICRARALAAGLPTSANYFAWISDSSDDAYCRLHGLGGKRANNCGLSTLPESAGPWLRTDNWPFAEAVGLLFEPTRLVYTPPRFDEFASPVSVTVPSVRVYTATGADGALQGSNTCQNWTDGTSASFAVAGDVSLTGPGWSNSGVLGCASDIRLLCMERIAGPSLPPVGNTGQIIFVTSAFGPGDLSAWPQAAPGTSGIAAGDSICASLAADAGFDASDTFRAWLSDGDTDALDRVLTQGPWVRPDMIPVASIPAALGSPSRFTSVAVTEQGAYLGNSAVWTGTADNGTGFGAHCDGWTDGTSTFQGRAGAAYRSALGWSSQFTLDCDSAIAHLYCLQDAHPDVIFLDGFEGNTIPF